MQAGLPIGVLGCNIHVAEDLVEFSNGHNSIHPLLDSWYVVA